MRLASIGPVGPLKTGIAYFHERFLPFLAEKCAVEVFADRPNATPDTAVHGLKIADIEDFLSDPMRFDAVLYHMGNHYHYHGRVYETLLKVPGFVLLHDCILSHFFIKYYLENGNVRSFRRVLAMQSPPELDAEVRRFYRAKADLYRFSMAGVISMASRGTIVMSEYGEQVIRKEAPETRVLRIHHPYFWMAEEGTGEVESFRSRYEIPSDCFIVTSFGHATPAKRLDVALDAFLKFHERFPESLFLLAGELPARSPVRRFLDISPASIRHLGYLENADLDALMEISDVCINLRYPSQGEMSGPLIYMLGRGKAVAVSNYAQFSEFPDEVCIKIDLGKKESDDLADALLRLATDDVFRRSLGEHAREYIAGNHLPQAAAQAVLDFIEANAAVGPLLAPESARALLDTDGFPLRQWQALTFNVRRICAYTREQGMARSWKEGLRRIGARRK